VAYVRTVRTASGATAVQIVHSSRRGSRDIEHVGSAHNGAELELLQAVARQRLVGGQGELDLGVAAEPAEPAAGGPLPITSSRMGHLWDALTDAYRVLGFDQATGGDEVFSQLVLARIIEPTSKLDSLRVLEETGVAAASYATVKRRLPMFAAQSWRQKLAAACAAHAQLGPASLVLYDVSTLYFETDTGDGFRESGFSKERRLEPQITIGLLTDAAGFPLMVNAFEGNKAETTTMLPTIQSFMKAHQLSDVTVMADAGMVSAVNHKQIEAAGLSFILGARIPEVPYVVDQWRRQHPGQDIPDSHVFVQPWPASSTDRRRDQVIYYQYKADRARRTLRGIDEQIAKAQSAVDGKTPVQQIHPTQRRHQNGQPSPGSQSSCGGRPEGLRHQPRGLPRRHPHHRAVRHRRLPPTVPYRAVVPHVQTRPAGPTDLPPPTRLDRGPPDHRVGRPGRQPLDRRPNRLVHPQVRPDRAPLPRHPDPDRRPHHHRRRPTTRRPPRRPQRDQRKQACALI
jgi:hypothetical protein